MEVHHHAHTARKKWTHYFWEFLMLFLAVFCGFLAEYQLEHKIERDRAKELARNLYYELKNDSLSLQQVNELRRNKEENISNLRQYLTNGNLARPTKEFFLFFVRGLYIRMASVFEPKDVVLEQLKNSGSLRYFKDDSLQKKIGELSVAIAKVRNRNEREDIFYNQYVVPFILKHYDHDWHDKITDNGKLSVTEAVNQYEKSTDPFLGSFKNLGQLNKEEARNMLSLYRQVLQNTEASVYRSYDNLNHEIQVLLRKRYKLK